MSFRGEDGAILIITLWILIILTILSVGVAGRVGLELKLTGFHRDSFKALYLAKAGVWRAISVIETKDPIDSLNDTWSNNSEEETPLFKEIKVSDAGTFTVSYPFAEGRTFYGIQDEDRRININNAPKEVIENLIEYLNPGRDASELAQLIEDWRDVESPDEYDYSDEGYPRKDNYFDAVEEILLVKDMTPAIFDNIKSYITVYPAKPECKINVNTATLPSLIALGIFPEEKAQQLIAERAGNDGEEGTKDDKPFNNQGEFNTFLNNVLGISLPPESVNLPAFESNYFRIISSGETSTKRAHKNVECVIGPHPTEGYQILFWKEQ